jgi:hypothetical protein
MRSTIMNRKRSTYVGGMNSTMSINKRSTMSRKGSVSGSFYGQSMAGSLKGSRRSTNRGSVFSRRGTVSGNALGDIEEEEVEDLDI